MRRSTTSAFLLLIQLFSFSASAWAICPLRKPQPSFLYHDSSATFIGTLAREHYRTYPDRWDSTYTFKVIRSFRGPDRASANVVTTHDSAAADLDQGKTYLVFARKDEDGRLRIYCGDFIEVKDVSATVQMMEDVVRRKGPVIITGKTQRGEDEHTSVIAGATVHVYGPAGDFRVTSDRRGRFRVKVPPGRYTVEAADPEGRKMDYSLYEGGIGPNNLLEPGEHVDLLLLGD
jgi:hypothetical protein